MDFKQKIEAKFLFMDVELERTVKNRLKLINEIVYYKKCNREIREVNRTLQKRKTLYEIILSFLLWMSFLLLLSTVKMHAQFTPKDVSDLVFFVESIDIRHNDMAATNDATDLDIARCETNDCLTEPFTELATIDKQYCDVTDDCGEGCVRRWQDQSNYSINNNGETPVFNPPEYITGRNFGQDDIVKPCYVDNCINGNPCIRGGGGEPFAIDGREQDKYLELQIKDYINLTGAFSIFLLAKPVVQNEDWFYFGQSVSFFRHRVEDNYLQLRVPGNSVWRVTPNNSVVLNKWQLIEVHRDATNKITIYIDGLDKTNSPNIILPGTFQFGYLLSGGKTNAGLGAELSMHGDIASFLIYNKITTGTENSNIRNYFDTNYLGNVLSVRKNNSNNSDIQLYPNPASEEFRVKVRKEVVRDVKNSVPKIYNTLGEKLNIAISRSETRDYLEYKVQSKNIEQGLYLINFESSIAKLIKR